MTDAIRPWCAKARYPGLDTFLAGSITMPSEARYDEIISELGSRFLEFLPPGFEIVELACGALFFQDASHE